MKTDSTISPGLKPAPGDPSRKAPSRGICRSPSVGKRGVSPGRHQGGGHKALSIALAARPRLLPGAQPGLWDVGGVCCLCRTGPEWEWEMGWQVCAGRHRSAVTRRPVHNHEHPRSAEPWLVPVRVLRRALMWGVRK